MMPKLMSYLPEEADLEWAYTHSKILSAELGDLYQGDDGAYAVLLFNGHGDKCRVNVSDEFAAAFIKEFSNSSPEKSPEA